MKRLPRLSKSGVLTPAQWDAVARVIEDNFRELRIQPGVGYTVTSSPGGVSFNVSGNGKTAATVPPFKILTKISSEGAVSLGVAPGTLYPELNPSITQSITGLLESAAPLDADSGWFAISSDTKVWLEYVPPLDGSPASVEVKHSTLSSTSEFDEEADVWTEQSVIWGDYNTSGDFTQEVARIMIGTVIYSTLEIDQIVTTDLMLQPFCILSKACKYFVPSWW